MPSDPSGINPKGVLVRPAPDWFDDHVAYGGFTAQYVGGDHFGLISLYNNASDGSSLKVYGVAVGADGGGGHSAWVDFGVPLGTLVGSCRPLRADLAVPWGQIYQAQQLIGAALPNPFTVPAIVAFLGSSGFDCMTYFSLFPMFIIPAGYALHSVNNFGSALLGASFWYHVAHE